MKPDCFEDFDSLASELYEKTEILKAFLIETKKHYSEAQYRNAIKILERFQDDLSEDLYLTF
jgi:hypothetical protein